MQRLHSDPTAGHFGVAKTIARIAQLYYWPGMFRKIARYVRECKNCLAHKAYQGKPAGFAHAQNVTEPWQQVTTDLVGPLPRSTNGHTWLLVAQDRFTKWVELQPMRKATGEAVTRALAELIIFRHGCPDTVISDNGRQFRSRQFSELLATFGIQHRTTPSYTPQCNPVGRTNKTIKTMISQYVGRNHRRWDEHLSALRYTYNSARHDATEFTPAYLNYGRELSPPHPDDRKRPRGAPSPSQWSRRLADAKKLVRINLARAFQRQEKFYNLRRRDWQPKVGETVWKKEHVLSNKLGGIN